MSNTSVAAKKPPLFHIVGRGRGQLPDLSLTGEEDSRRI
jgi:hypothetical protein